MLKDLSAIAVLWDQWEYGLWSLPYVGIVPETVSLAEYQHPCTSVCLLYVVSDNLRWLDLDDLC